MEDTDFQKALLTYTIHMADNQTRIAEATVTISQHSVTISQQLTAVTAILERVIQTTDRTEQMVAKILAGTAPATVSH